MTGINVGSTPVKIVGYGCGNDTVPVAVTETKRLMEKLNADVMVGPLSGDEAVYVANYAKAHPTKTFIIGTAGSQDPTMQIHPKNLFRYHGDGAQWNAGIGEIAYKKLGWRKAAIIMDDYSFGWTSGAGMIADFCAVGGNIVKRVFPPLNTTDYAPFVRQLPPPNQVDGYFSAVGGTGTAAMLKAYEQAYGKLDPKQVDRQPVLRLPRRRQGRRSEVRRRLHRRLGHRPGRPRRRRRRRTSAVITKWYGAAKLQRRTTASSTTTTTAALGAGAGSGRSPAAPSGAKLQASLPRTIEGRLPGLERRLCEARLPPPGDPGPVPAPARQERRRVGGSDRWSRTCRAWISRSAACSSRPSPPHGPHAVPACKKVKTPWQGKIKVVTNGKITNQVLK